MNFETNALETKISEVYVTLEMKFWTAYMSLEKKKKKKNTTLSFFFRVSQPLK